MKTKITHRRTVAYYTTNPGEIHRLMTEAEKITMPESIYRTAADIAATVMANSQRTEREQPATIAAYVLRYAYMLSRAGELIEAPPRVKKKQEGGSV